MTLAATLDALYALVPTEHRLAVRWLALEYARRQLADVADGDEHDASLDLLGELASALKAFADPYVSVEIDDV